ncbi:uncharacterized protein LOC131882275 [Tigriopus californicus]|uniref:uncharacterized protein LOC131882275 n=1 Tax=Tigriopus californicus TaxID=6832 RepID=UPI0027D9FD1D|nr:uncharacterized protein LOC131882275 [Tigriopus californicus]
MERRIVICLKSVKKSTQVFRTIRINLSPFTKDFRVWERPIENTSIYLRAYVEAWYANVMSARGDSWGNGSRSKSHPWKLRDITNEHGKRQFLFQKTTAQGPAQGRGVQEPKKDEEHKYIRDELDAINKVIKKEEFEKAAEKLDGTLI